MDEENKTEFIEPIDPVQLRSEEFQEVLGHVPSWILRWGITLIASILIILLAGSTMIKYPDVIPARIVLTGSVPPAIVTARTSGKLNELFVSDNRAVNAGDYLAVIDNPANTEDVLRLKAFMDDFAGRDAINRVSTLPPQDLHLGTLQVTYSNFHITLFNYLEYNRLLYYPQKVQMTKERIRQYEEQFCNLQRQQQLMKEQFGLAQNQFRRDSTLYSTWVISQEELEKSQNTYLQSKLSEENMRSTLNSMQIQIAQLKEQLLDAGQKDTETLNGLQTQLQSLVTQLKTEIQSWEMAYVLTAPVDGKITFTNFWVSNQNVQAGDAVYYTVEIGLPDQLITTYRKELPYLPNMQGQADIVTEDISLLERLILPLKRILRESI
ncbi:hypothetical protein FACS1894182_13750 [Bacteroidia bacterium]|nr:hypothetical protein FACS1894182_13750 [Bacteroidia bacterium]